MSVYKKLFEAKKEIGKISKDSKNPFFKSNYLSLNGLIEAVETVLEKHDLLLLQPIMDNKVRSIIVDTNNDDGKLDNVFSEMALPNITDPQKLGSAITYFRRYTLESLLGLTAEDDDGNKAVAPTKVNITQKQVQQAIDKGIDTINKTLAYYDGKTVREGNKIYCMSEGFKESLKAALTV